MSTPQSLPEGVVAVSAPPGHVPDPAENDAGFLGELFGDDPGTPNADPEADAPADEADPADDHDEDGDESDTDPDPLAAEADKWKSLARKHERRAKVNADAAAELATIKASPEFAALKGDGKAAQAIRAEVRAEYEGLYAERMLRAELRAAAAGTDLTTPDEDGATPLDALVSTLNARAFLTEDGDVDVSKVTGLIKTLAPKRSRGRVDLGQGKRGSAPAKNKADELLSFLDQNF